MNYRRPRSVFALAILLPTAYCLLPTPFPARSAQDDPAKKKSPTQPGVYKGRQIAYVMTAEGGGAEWLERRDRDASEQPERVIDALKIAPSSVVADVGAGTGYFSLRIAKRLTTGGRMLATDVQPEMIRLLTENAKKAGLKNVEPILCTDDDAKLPAGKVDLALMVDVYHELQDPEGAMAQIRKSLKPDGRLVLVEYRGEDPSVPIKPEHKTTLRQIRYEIEPMGFRLKEVFEFLPHQHVEVFVRDEMQGEDVISNPKDFPTIRKLGWAGVGAAEPYEAAGFKRLFDGKDLTGWSDAGAEWSIRDGAIVGDAANVGDEKPTITTAAAFDDFELDLQFRIADTEASAAVTIRSHPRLRVRLDAGVPHVEGYPETIATRRTGEVTAVDGGKPIRPTTDLANSLVLPAEWNRLTIRSAGRRVMIGINGVQTAEFDSGTGDLAGSVGLEVRRGEAEFREVWINRSTR